MKINKQAGPPEDLLYFDDEVNLTPLQVEDVVEIFNTPLTGSYNWDYTIADNRIKKLYELGKELNWNGSIDLQWDYTHPADEKLVEPDEQLPHETLEAYENLTDEEKILFDRHSTAELMSQFLHGEQGALLVASQLASCAPTYNAKLYAASQTFDEARHVEVFNRYLQEKIGIHYPINPNLKALIDKILTDERWDLKFIGMQIIIEGLALAAFQMAKALTKTRGEKSEAQLLYIEWRANVLQAEAEARAAEIRLLMQDDPVFQAEQRRDERLKKERLKKDNSGFMRIIILSIIILIIYLIFLGLSN